MKTQTGWMIENGKVLVYPTLRQTRKECVSEYCSRSGMTPTHFKKSGNHKCVKVAVTKVT